jgi:transposase-like protein
MRREDRRRQIRQLIDQWRESGETAAAFAERHGMGRRTFYRWRRRLARETTTRAGLVPVHVLADERCAFEAIEIFLSTGDRVRVSVDVPEMALRRVVQVLRARC